MSVPKTMKALVAYSQTDYRFVPDFPVPECGPDDIIIKSEGCGICAGDLKCQHGAQMFWGGGIQKQLVKPPFIPGHEFLGTVVEMGSNIKSCQIGDRITADQIIPCRECRFCKTGHYWMCQPHDVFGFQSHINGGMAEYIRLPKNSIISRVPVDMPLKDALLIEPYGCSKHCVDRAQIGCEDITVISGAGALGLGMVTYARMKNPAKLIVLDMQDNRLEKAKEFGADIVWNPGKVDVVAEILKITDNYGCDIYIEATGHPSSVIQGIQMIRKLGRFVEFSVFTDLATIDWSIIGDRKELDVLGAHLSPYCYEPVIKWIADGSLPTAGIVSHTFSLDDWKTAFEYAKTGKDNSFKVAIIPGL